MTTEKGQMVSVGSGALVRRLEEIAAEQRGCESQCIHAPKAKAMYARRAADIEATLGQVRNVIAALEKCFWHLGDEIKRKTINESAADGTQALSREVGRILDAASPNSVIRLHHVLTRRCADAG